MAISDYIYHKWDGVRGAGMEGYLFMCYGIDPPNLPEYFDGCGASFDICHALDCKKVGLIMACHNKLCDGVANLASKFFTPTHVKTPKFAVHGGKDKIKGLSSQDVRYF